MTEVSVRELKNNLSRYLREVEAGYEVTVTRRGKKVATLAPAENKKAQMSEGIRRLVESGLVKWSGKKPALPKRRVRLQGEGPTISEMIIRDRDDHLL